MEASNDDDLRGPALSLMDYREGAPSWWVRGTNIRDKHTGQKARAAYSISGDPVALLERGISGVFKQLTRFEDWVLDEVPLDLTPMERARIAYSADRALLSSLGVPGVPEWMGMVEQRRIEFMAMTMERAPFTGEYANIRTRLRDSIVKALLVSNG